MWRHENRCCPNQQKPNWYGCFCWSGKDLHVIHKGISDTYRIIYLTLWYLLYLWVKRKELGQDRRTVCTPTVCLWSMFLCFFFFFSFQMGTLNLSAWFFRPADSACYQKRRDCAQQTIMNQGKNVFFFRRKLKLSLKFGLFTVCCKDQTKIHKYNAYTKIALKRQDHDKPFLSPVSFCLKKT